MMVWVWVWDLVQVLVKVRVQFRLRLRFRLWLGFGYALGVGFGLRFSLCIVCHSFYVPLFWSLSERVWGRRWYAYLYMSYIHHMILRNGTA